jgi:hypothetical protein
VPFLPWYEHIPLHRLWVIVRVGHIPSSIEARHLVECEDCLTALSVCLNARNFGTALRILSGPGDTESKAS